MKKHDDFNEGLDTILLCDEQDNDMNALSDDNEDGIKFSEESSYDDASLYRQYLKDASIYQLYEREEEIAVARRIDNGKIAAEILEKYYKGGQDHNSTLVVTEVIVDECYHPSPKDDNKKFPFQKELDLKYKRFIGADIHELKFIVEDGKAAANDMVCHNLRLVCSICKRYYGAQLHGMSMNDLIQEGNIGLIKAASKFEYRLGYKFATYAHWWIIHTIGRAIANQGNTIRIPVHVSEVCSKYDKTKRELTITLSREPSIKEIADCMGMDEGKLYDMITSARTTISIDQPVNGDEDLTIERYLEDKGEAPHDRAMKQGMQYDIRKALNVLTEKEQKIIVERYGLDGRQSQTLETLGKRYGVTGERIRRIEADALKKLRTSPAKKTLEDYAWD